jgi:alanine-synthesizing transaminase
MQTNRAPIVPARRSENIRYAVRDILLVAERARRAGKELLYLNIGDPNRFDFQTPPHIVEAIARALRDNHTYYAASEGIPEALAAIRADAEARGIRAIQDVYVGNGGSECIELALSALVNEGENVMTPSPGYPLYTAVLAKLGCPENPYYLDEANGWQPDLDDIRAKIDARTRAIVLINPNNPTGSVCERRTLEGLLELAARHDLVIFADEIYDKLLLGDERNVSIASLDVEQPVLTFNGLSKAYLGPGLRMGWCVMSGPAERLAPLREAIHKFLRARLCASTIVQHAIAPALTGDQSHLALARRKLTARRDLTVSTLNATPSLSCVAPRAAFYAFPRIETGEPDATLIPCLIAETGVVVVPGSGFGQRPGSSHFRVVFLPPEETLRRAYAAIASFIARPRPGGTE